MREVSIQFEKEGTRISEIDDRRNYFFTEIEEIIRTLKKKTGKSQLTYSKRFTLYIDGKQILISHLSINNNDKQTFQQKIINIIENYEAWEEQKKHLYINKLNKVIDIEKELFLNREFKAFATQLDLKLHSNIIKPSLAEMNIIFEKLYAGITSGFFSKLEDVIISVSQSYCIMINQLLVNIVSKLNEKEKNEFILNWFKDNNNFLKFTQLVIANFHSLNPSRLDYIKVRYQLYQQIQYFLFYYVAKQSFDIAYAKHLDLESAYRTQWNEILCSGVTLDDENKVMQLVLENVLQDFIIHWLNNEIETEEREFLNRLVG